MIELMVYIGAGVITVVILLLIARMFLGMLVGHVHISQIPESSAKAFQTRVEK